MITNLETDPDALMRRYQWGASSVQAEDGRHWKYVGRGNSFMGSCSQEVVQQAPVGHVIVLIAQTVDTAFANAKIWQADELLAVQNGDIYVKAARITETGRNHEVTISECTTGVTILGSALYTPDDWDKILDLYTSDVLQYPWIAGESIPLRGGVHAPSVYPHAIFLEVAA